MQQIPEWDPNRSWKVYVIMTILFSLFTLWVTLTI